MSGQYTPFLAHRKYAGIKIGDNSIITDGGTRAKFNQPPLITSFYKKFTTSFTGTWLSLDANSYTFINVKFTVSKNYPNYKPVQGEYTILIGQTVTPSVLSNFSIDYTLGFNPVQTGISFFTIDPPEYNPSTIEVDLKCEMLNTYPSLPTFIKGLITFV